MKQEFGYSTSVQITLVSMLLTAFNYFSEIKVLQLIMKLATIIQIARPLKETFKLLYDKCLEVETNSVVGGEDTMSHENSLVKMCLMLESNIINIFRATSNNCAACFDNKDDKIPTFHSLFITILNQIKFLFILKLFFCFTFFALFISEKLRIVWWEFNFQSDNFLWSIFSGFNKI